MRCLLIFLLCGAFLFRYSSNAAATFLTDVQMVNTITNITAYATDNDCKSAGIFCDCDTPNVVYVCIGIGDGFIIEETDHCKDGYTCNRKEGGCSDKINPECSKPSDYKMDCTSVGIFPDPYSCKGYHICVTEDDQQGGGGGKGNEGGEGNEGGKNKDNKENDDSSFKKKEPSTTPENDSSTTPENDDSSTTPKNDGDEPTKPKPKYKVYNYECQGNYSFNPATAFCDIPLNDGVCESSLIEVCKNASYFPIAIPQNPSLYYLCVRDPDKEGAYKPKIFKCEHGEKFVNGQCFNGLNNTDCKAKKNVAVEDNCLYYYDCSNGLPQPKRCPPGRSFHKVKRTCVQGFTNC